MTAYTAQVLARALALVLLAGGCRSRSPSADRREGGAPPALANVANAGPALDAMASVDGGATAGDARLDVGDARPAAGCLGSGALQVAQADGGVRVCSVAQDSRAQDDRRCVAIDLATGETRDAPYTEPPPPPMMPSGTVNLDTARPVACFRGTCRRIKKRLRAALREAARLYEARRDDDGASQGSPPTVTTDLKAVAFSSGWDHAEIWSIAADRPIKRRDGDDGAVDEIDGLEVYDLAIARAVGNEIYTFVKPPVARVFTSDGLKIQHLGSEQGQIGMLDDRRWLALANHELYVFDGNGAHDGRSVELAPGVETSEILDAGFTVLPDGTVAVAIRRPDQPSVLVVDPRRGEIVRAWPLTACDGS